MSNKVTYKTEIELSRLLRRMEKEFAKGKKIGYSKEEMQEIDHTRSAIFGCIETISFGDYDEIEEEEEEETQQVEDQGLTAAANIVNGDVN